MRRIVRVFSVALVMVAMMVPATPAFAIPEDSSILAGNGPSVNAVEPGLTTAVESIRSKNRVSVASFVITKKIDKASSGL